MIMMIFNIATKEESAETIRTAEELIAVIESHCIEMLNKNN